MFQNFTMRRGIMLILLLQGALAGLMLLSQLEAHGITLVSPKGPDTLAPISPGDQVRRFTPRNPGNLDFTDEPTFALPETPGERLQFSEITDPDLGPLILLSGPIEDGDALRFRGFIAGLGGEIPPIALHSPGGLVKEAIAIGERVRQLNLNTLVLPGAYCFSSCPYILAGGVERIVSLRGAVGLHQHYYEAPGYLPAFLAVEDIQIGQGKTMEHLMAMGVAAEVMLHSLRTRPDEIYVLVEEELMESRLATSVWD